MDADIRLKLSVEDQESVQKLEQDIQRTKKALADLQAQMGNDPFGAFKFGPQIKAATADLQKFQSQLAALESKASNQKFDVGPIRNVGRVAQDLQYGFSAITNNLVEIAPLLGAGAVALDVWSKNAETIADKIKGWRDGLDSSHQGLKDNLSILEDVVRATDLSKGSIAKGLGGFLADFFPEISGLPAAGRFLKGDPVAEAEKAADAAANRDLAGVLGQDEEDRRKALRDTISFLGGSAAFKGILEANLGKEAGAAAVRDAAAVLRTGGAAEFQNVLAGLGDKGDILKASLPDPEAERLNNQAEESGRELTRQRQARQAADRKLVRQLEDDGKANEKFGEQQLKDQQDADKLRRKGDIDQAQGRLKWLNTLKKEFERDPKVFGDFSSFLNSVQTAGGADGGLNKTNSLLEHEIKVQEAQLEALRNFSANVGP